ncbi:hypothetical protein L1276_004381 [Flavobacterium sp. HSC-32F16]|uniref:hypothetical protein n=1 Tax=Flavobacterium sp. HSC-32F16 TaxID=2910964 RepID=UPI0020A327CA|nr:hypothetical protein [Flavobacterium sp. HSC-32F16]MCP2029197.1 hypothetical protein [Flavobacterium sp. HSC-32F16]
MNIRFIILFGLFHLSIFSFGSVTFQNDIIIENKISVLDFGALGNGIADDSDAFEKAILYCVKNGKTLYIPKSKKSYNLNKSIRIELVRGDKIKIISNQAIISPKITDTRSAYKLTPFKEHVFISIGRKINSIHTLENPDENIGTEIFISGLIIDGVQQEITKNVDSFDDDIYIAAQLIAEKVSVENCVFTNILGYGLRIHDVLNSTITKCKFKNVGGRGYTQFANKIDMDAFGDAIYHAKVSENANITINDCSFEGKISNKKRSRSALTFEYSIFPYNVSMNNIDIQGYAKCLHIEETAKTIFRLNNVKFKDFNFAIANVLNDSSKIYLNKSIIKVGFNDGNDHGDALAFLNYHSTAQIYVSDSELDFNGRQNAYQSVVGLVKVERSTIKGNNTNFFFADSNTIFSYCKFINFGGSEMSFFSNDPQKKYKIEESKFIGNPYSSVKSKNVTLEINE